MGNANSASAGPSKDVKDIDMTNYRLTKIPPKIFNRKRLNSVDFSFNFIEQADITVPPSLVSLCIEANFLREINFFNNDGTSMKNDKDVIPRPRALTLRKRKKNPPATEQEGEAGKKGHRARSSSVPTRPKENPQSGDQPNDENPIESEPKLETSKTNKKDKNKDLEQAKSSSCGDALDKIDADTLLLKDLRLGANNLDICPMLGALCNLTRLQLSHNLITEIPENALPKSLQNLILNNNKLTKFPSAALQLPNMFHLNLMGNEISQLSGDLSMLSMLFELTLSENPCVDGIDDNFFLGLPVLTKLYMSDMKLKSLPSSLYELKNLKELALENNELELLNVPEGEWSLPSLTLLTLTKNQLFKAPDFPQLFENLPVLRDLRLQHNMLENVPESLSLCTDLEKLSLDCNRIKEIPLLSVNSLRVLHANFNCFGEGSLENVYKLVNLHVLHLCNNEISAVAEPLLDLTCLVRLNLSNNRLQNMNYIPKFANLGLGSTFLCLSGNLLTSIPSTGLDNIKILLFDNNPITELEPTIFDNCNPRRFSFSLGKEMNMENLLSVYFAKEDSQRIYCDNAMSFSLEKVTSTGQEVWTNMANGLVTPMNNKYGAFRMTGLGMHDLEDRVSVAYSDKLKLEYYAVFDGHGGELVSDFVEENFLPIAEQSLVKHQLGTLNDDELQGVFTDAFQEVNEQLRKIFTNQKSTVCGSTGAVCLFNDEYIYSANVGDSRTIICTENENGEFLVERLSFDHNPGDPGETSRIRKEGGSIYSHPNSHSSSSNRLIVRAHGNIGVSRSFGDFVFEPYMSVVPYVRKIKRDPSQRFIFIGCDGIYDVLSDSRIIEYVSDFLKLKEKSNLNNDNSQNMDTAEKTPTNETNTKDKEKEEEEGVKVKGNPEETDDILDHFHQRPISTRTLISCAASICQMAYSLGSGDDLSAVIVML